MWSTSYREPGLGESQEMESIMKRVAEMDRTKPIGEYLIPHPKRYLVWAVFSKENTKRVAPRVDTRLLIWDEFFNFGKGLYQSTIK